MSTSSQLLTDYFRCPATGVEFVSPVRGKAPSGFFRFGDGVICYGSSSAMPLACTAGQPLYDALDDVCFESSQCMLPFDPAEVVSNLRRERYAPSAAGNGNGHGLHSAVRRAYYGVRPLLPVGVRKHFQRLFLAGRMGIPFPNWPVDRTVDRLLERLLVISMKARGLVRIPFIWFWPEGHTSAVMMTHDVEMPAGMRFCSTLMDIDEQHGLRSSFQLVPEDRYAIPELLFREIRSRGFEINVHDLNHDGRLYWTREEFLRRAAKINQYARTFGAKGFRAGVLYRNLDWYDAFDFAYDMSVPNVGHLDPQAGGCCTVMPYFVGGILELPVTTTQDYPLFQIHGEYSMELWNRQINLILDGHGLISFITHPDYLIERRARASYKALLASLARLRSEAGCWFALPGEVNEWWRARSRMRLVQENGTWRIEGDEKERARIAYACADGNGVRFTTETGAMALDRPVAQFSNSGLQASA